VLWHLKGERDELSNGVDLSLRGRRMSVFWPLAGSRHAAEIHENRDAPPFYEYKADWDVALTARGDRAAFATLFLPDRDRGTPDVQAAEVRTLDGADAHPLAAGLALGGEDGYLLGARTRAYPTQYEYAGMRIDAEAFVLCRRAGQTTIDFANGRTFCLPDVHGSLWLNGEPIASECFTRSQDRLVVEWPGPVSGTLVVGGHSD
jgi:hypothetical protein